MYISLLVGTDLVVIPKFLDFGAAEILKSNVIYNYVIKMNVRSGNKQQRKNAIIAVFIIHKINVGVLLLTINKIKC